MRNAPVYFPTSSPMRFLRKDTVNFLTGFPFCGTVNLHLAIYNFLPGILDESLLLAHKLSGFREGIAFYNIGKAVIKITAFIDMDGAYLVFINLRDIGRTE